MQQDNIPARSMSTQCHSSIPDTVPAVSESDCRGSVEQTEGPILVSAVHPLQNTWTIWYANLACKMPSRVPPSCQSPGTQQKQLRQYEENLASLSTFSTLEDFAACYGYLKRPSELPNNSNLFVFKGTTKPMWEVGNCSGSILYSAHRITQMVAVSL